MFFKNPTTTSNLLTANLTSANNTQPRAVTSLDHNNKQIIEKLNNIKIKSDSYNHSNHFNKKLDRLNGLEFGGDTLQQYLNNHLNLQNTSLLRNYKKLNSLKLTRQIRSHLNKKRYLLNARSSILYKCTNNQTNNNLLSANKNENSYYPRLLLSATNPIYSSTPTNLISQPKEIELNKIYKSKSARSLKLNNIKKTNDNKLDEMHHDLKEQNTPNNTDASSIKTSTTKSTFNSNHSDLNSINSTSQVIKNGILIDRKFFFDFR